MQVKGEKLILAANGIKGVATVALRPSGIFGEGDPLLVPITVDKAKAGKMKFMIGDGKNLMDFTYVGNVALAHIKVRHVQGSRTCPSAQPQPVMWLPCEGILALEDEICG